MGTPKRDYPRKTARKLKQIRLRLGLSQGEIAKELGIKNRARISVYETGKREAPVTLLLKYARLADVPLETLVDDKIKWP